MNKNKIEFITQLVSEHFNITLKRLTGTNKSRMYSAPRQICWHLMHINGIKQTAIAKHFETIPSRISFGRKKVRDLISVGDWVKGHVEELNKKIQEHESETKAIV